LDALALTVWGKCSDNRALSHKNNRKRRHNRKFARMLVKRREDWWNSRIKEIRRKKRSNACKYGADIGGKGGRGLLGAKRTVGVQARNGNKENAKEEYANKGSTAE